MNERIKEIALQAGGSHYPTVGGKTLEKFAELIVRECANFVDSHEQIDKYGEAQDTVYGKDLLEHFGVKE
jgi:hypothetical protein